MGWWWRGIDFSAGDPLDEEAQEARVEEMNRRLLTQHDLPEFEHVPLTQLTS